MRMMERMIDRELIKDYIREVYIFASNSDGWCIKDRNKNWYMLLHSLIVDLEKIFPDMGATEICTEWYYRNVDIIESKIYYFLSEYKLRLRVRPIEIWNNAPSDAWEVINNLGQTFNPFMLMTILPSHHNGDAIKLIYDRWFDEQKIIVMEKLI